MRATLLLFMLLSAAPAAAQTTDKLHQVRLRDGTTMVGHIASQDSLQVILVSLTDARYELSRANIKELRETSGRVVNGEFWPADPNDTRLFFTATGRSVGKGSGYIGTYFVALPFVAFGVTDRLTIAGGAPILFGQVKPFYIAPKYQVVARRDAAVSVGALSFFGDEEFETFGFGYGVATLGNRDNALTAGLGFGYAGDDVAERPIIALGGEARVSPRIKLLTENWIIPGGATLLSGGIRILGDRWSGDVGIMRVSADDEALCCLPLINIAYAIGRRR